MHGCQRVVTLCLENWLPKGVDLALSILEVAPGCFFPRNKEDSVGIELLPVIHMFVIFTHFANNTFNQIRAEI